MDVMVGQIARGHLTCMRDVFQGLVESRPLDRFSMGGVEFSVTERRLAVARGPVMRGAAELQCVGCLCQGVEVGFEFSQLRSHGVHRNMGRAGVTPPLSVSHQIVGTSGALPYPPIHPD
jgi:hypothetical protein